MSCRWFREDFEKLKKTVATQSNRSECEFDSCDLQDVKFIPNASSFMLESQKRGKESRTKKTGNLQDKSNTLNQKRRIDDNYSNEGHYYDPHTATGFRFSIGPLLSELPELRDSYDQFCSAIKEHDLQDEIEKRLDLSVFSVVRDHKSSEESFYSSDESIHARKRRRKMGLEQIQAEVKNKRWSLPEFSKLLEYSETFPGYCKVNFPVMDEIVNAKPKEITRTSIPCLVLSSHESPKENVYKPHESVSNGKTILDGLSCHPFSNYQNSSYDHPSDYEYSDIYDDDDSFTSSPMQSRMSLNTMKENPQSSEDQADIKDSGIYANDDFHGNDSCSDVSTNDSGFVDKSRTMDSQKDEIGLLFHHGSASCLSY
ncbi:uncharacterized protein LOC124446302 isoform X3 [Xenia sp. Carnegie-2017]|uniref:uncharacterized protein LOC124446302 isoform X3 n=1 Tax=Xenia sp. Carnegie-2017 TaxID=2897299 RepID=UPI001F033BF2|nr:uncharacterized protein LOC124446302 isoform X3 [Xenia sp. Carnegie-2017]